MKRWVALLTAFAFAFQPFAALAQSPSSDKADIRLYLRDGTIIEGKLVERSDDLFIVDVGHEIFTFERDQIEKLVTIESLGGQARTIAVKEYPYISFLGGTAVFSLLALLQFNRAGDRDDEADLNQERNILGRAKKLRDEASRARVFGWTSVVLAAGTLGFALYPHKATRKILPEASLGEGGPTLKLSYVQRF